MSRNPGTHKTLLLAASVFTTAGCNGSPNLSASFGGPVAGRRGEVQVLFLNNTPYRAVFTFGTYDQTDQFSEPDFRQFGHEEGGLVLEGESASGIGALDCARVFSIGGSELLDLITENLSGAPVLDEALIEGVEFFSIPAGEDTEEVPTPVSQGKAAPFAAQLGVDFPCNALLIIRFEIDDLGSDPFRIDFELIPSSSTR